ncbi:hypothetical protein AMTR_s00088p00168730 [Amborella trichopoda]|uniref:FRIGIDA-like protein n=1 Tax=Amborella trichopoda TaxID=13333 RepID=W1NVI4_AMBTC|nr:hypothetical protein AMTR_s00088p00168730 [Amborella trichopoda]
MAHLGRGFLVNDGFIKKLISRGKYIEAVNFVYAFGLVDKFEPVTYLTSYMRENKKAADEILSIGKRSVKAQNKAAEKEMSGLRAVIKCAKEHGLQDRIFCDDLKKRIAHLHESMMERNKQASSDIKNKKKRARIDHAPGPTLASSPGPDGPMGFFGLAQGHIEMPPVYSYPGEKQVVGSYGHGGSSPYERPAGLGPCLSSLSGSHRSQAPMSRTQLYSEESRMSGGLPYLAPTCGSGYGTPTNRGSCSYGAAPVGGSAFYSTSAIAKSGSYMAEPASASGAYGTIISGGTGSFRVEPIGGSGSNHAMPIGGSGSYRVAPNGGSGSYGTGPPLVSGSYDSGPTSGSRFYGSEAMNGSGSYRGLGSYDGYFYGGAVSLLTSNDDCSRMSQAVQMCPHNGVRF